jgi:hypothetical protein
MTRSVAYRYPQGVFRSKGRVEGETRAGDAAAGRRAYRDPIRARLPGLAVQHL